MSIWISDVWISDIFRTVISSEDRLKVYLAPPLCDVPTPVVRAARLGSGQVRSGQLGSVPFMSARVKSARSARLESGQVRSDQVSPGHIIPISPPFPLCLSAAAAVAAVAAGVTSVTFVPAVMRVVRTTFTSSLLRVVTESEVDSVVVRTRSVCRGGGGRGVRYRGRGRVRYPGEWGSEQRSEYLG